MTKSESEIPLEEVEPTVQPFEPGPASFSGCGKPAVIGCLVLLVFLGLSMIVLVTQSRKLLGWTMDKVKEQVVANLPVEVDEIERERLERAFESAAEVLASGEIDPGSVRKLQRVVAIVQASAGKLTAEQVSEVTRLLEEIADEEPTSGEQPRSGPGMEGTRAKIAVDPLVLLPPAEWSRLAG